MPQFIRLSLCIGLFGMLVAGCARKDQLAGENPAPEAVPEMPAPETAAPQAPVAPQAEAVAPGAPEASGQTPALPAPTANEEKLHYVVKDGDSLWEISGKKQIFNDPFRWPLLFKTNRDQIVDPDLIEPGQDLSYLGNYDQASIDQAVAKAKETPAYHPHSAPRKRLPISY